MSGGVGERAVSERTQQGNAMETRVYIDLTGTVLLVLIYNMVPLSPL